MIERHAHRVEIGKGSLIARLARPQFRELIAQVYLDPDSNRQFRGNPSLIDSERQRLITLFSQPVAETRPFSTRSASKAERS